MLYNTGTIAINGNSATGTGTNWTAPASQVRAGQTIIVMSNPVQLFQISSVNSATSMTVTPAASPALSGQKYGILVSDIISVDGLAQAMSQLIKEYDENIGAWETFASTSANQSITVTINGTAVTIPGIGKLAQKGSNGAVTVADGGTGATNAADARTNLGLGEGSALPVGVPVPWPSATPPTGWLKCNGAVFSAEEYPELAKAYPTNKLPDLRGEFIRGWDDGRGVDSGRALLSAQGDAIRDISGKLLGLMTTAGSQMTADEWVTGAFNAVYEGGAGQTTSSPGSRYDVGFSAARVVPTAEENRPRNIAFNYIVRAS
ncbi:tail fiber protein [Escherichia coli]|uniref:phage tail protein n=1 Tax=Escherichia coli TaxID=562 RepID=UPI00128F9B52|nr:phage tail protein [Escherichia coli]MQI21719.1 tail fiber protein [Escherichia coli]MQI35900.1 tail fiber protein [Escherichia coli]MQI50842.1 tail fiber protein [Escherichia coli]MQJ10482.1 tail fiber protein [Escherichia coli]MQJ59743.1 tail fiber protein [Escherichia coli]